MKALIRKEFLLCLHPTAVVFLSFAALVFVPNYPYEVIFFFSGLSIFFICMSARENGDTVFTCSLPVKKRQVPLARMLIAVIFECALLILTGVCICVKQAIFPKALLINAVGNSANLAFCGIGGILLGTFNLVFFPLHYRDPNRVGVPFLIAMAVQFVLIGLMIAIRHFPFYVPLTLPDGENSAVKLIVLFGGLAFCFLSTLLAARLAMKAFERVDL